MKELRISILDFAIIIIYIVLATYFAQKTFIMYHCEQVGGAMVKDMCVPKTRLSVCLIGDSGVEPPYPLPNMSYEQWINLTSANLSE